MRKRHGTAGIWPTRAPFWAVLALVAVGVAASGSAPAAPGPPRLFGLYVSNGDTPFAGDGPRLTTVSPNGDGFRDRATIRFRLDQPATVEVQIVATRPPPQGVQIVWATRKTLRSGPNTILWKPTPSTPIRTYLVRFVVTGRTGGRRVYGFEQPSPHHGISGAVVRIQGIEVGFLERSYGPRGQAAVSIATDAKRLRLQLFSVANIPSPTVRDLRTRGVAMTPAVRLDWSDHRDAPDTVQVARAGNWPSGLYFLRVTAGDGRVGYAPLIQRPSRLGEHKVAVVLSTSTWQAYNFLDANGDGWGDSWYLSDATRAVDLQRPYLDFGLTSRYRDWDLSVISWLKRTGKAVDFLSDDDLARVRSGDDLRRAYNLVVFPGHEEYATQHVYDVVRRYRDRGGHLMFLAANNFFWKVSRDGQLLRRVRMWRDLARPEAALVGVQHVAVGRASVRRPFVVTGAGTEPWVFAGTGFSTGSAFGRFGIEFDSRAPGSPPGTVVLARIPRLLGGRHAEMTYYETAAGAKVFAAGALDFAASIRDPAVSRLVDNVWARLAAR